MRRLAQWFHSRTGIYDVIQHALYENIPSGARWRYITGSMLVFAFAVQAITGIFLWMAYSPSSQTAYESVYYIQHEMTGGWLLRGVHHFMAQAMVIVMGLHILQVIIDGAYRAPREVNYWLGIILMQLVMGLGLTGYLLPWDQKGYWATNVATNLMTLVPFVGKELQQIAVGGNEYGHHTLTRFFAMHTGVLPAALIGFLILHIAAFRKHGIMATITPGRPDQYFWPHQVLLDAVGCLVLLGIVLLCVIHFDVAGLATGNLPAAHQGAELGAPADASEAYSAARPEWYYLFLFQLLKYFHGTQEIIGAIILPGIVLTILALAPILGRWNWGHAFNVGYLLFLIAAVGVLTTAAFVEDSSNYEFQEAKKEAA
ncbi:MAG: cytochrome b N-terminal domain-containing protein, partial [Pirellulaceae bacterium]|nr:cytochrome b N-terminal domain-containing protein [Pirellulaceae bacterium]